MRRLAEALTEIVLFVLCIVAVPWLADKKDRIDA